MSHFTVLVVDDAEMGVEESLAPYNEDVGEGDPYCQFIVEVKHDEVRKKIEKLIDDQFIYAGVTALRRNTESEVKEKKYKVNQKRIDELREILKKTDKEISAYLQEYYKYKVDAKGNLGYWGNPNAKWDWYMIGGRWNNELKTKDGQQVNECLKEELDIKEAFNTSFALVVNGVWHEKAEMGWWACTSDDKNEEDWKKEFMEALETVSDKAEITLVDAHI